MKTLYLDLISGVSGDMFIGALLDLGVKLPDLERALATLGVGGYHLHVGRQSRSGIVGTKFDVHLEAGHHHHHGHDDHAHERRQGGHGHEPGDAHGLDHPHDHAGHSGHAHEEHHGHHAGSRDFAAIKQLIEASQLSPWVKEKSVAVFRRVAVAEGKIHGQSPEEVHFHEVGAIDSIVDIVGACIGLELLGQPRVVASPVVEGTGWVRCAHGRFPVPTPATLEILGARGVAVSQCEEPHELVTPTGAALLAELAESFGPMRGLRAEQIGYGIGTRENRTRPNVLRAILGEVEEEAPSGARDWETDTVVVLETNLDDVTAEVLGPFVEMALAAGALDAFHTAVQMKKGRPGVLLSVLCHPADADRFSEMMLRETSAFGIRRIVVERRKLRREFHTVTTAFGDVRVKVGKLDGTAIQVAPEFDDCRRVAAQAAVPVRQVYAAALAAAQQLATAS